MITSITSRYTLTSAITSRYFQILQFQNITSSLLQEHSPLLPLLHTLLEVMDPLLHHYYYMYFITTSLLPLLHKWISHYFIITSITSLMTKHYFNITSITSTLIREASSLLPLLHTCLEVMDPLLHHYFQ